MQSLIGPFGDEAVAAIIAAVMSAVLTIWVTRRSRSKPKHINCTEVERTSLYYVREEVEGKTKVTYNDIDVKQLSLVRLNLRNSGSEEICGPWIKVKVRGPKKILDIVSRVSPERPISNLEVKHIRSEVDGDASEIEFQLDYINAYSDHREEILIDLVSDGKAKSLDVLGAGAGWSVQFKSQETLRALLVKFNVAFLLTFLGPPGLYIPYSFWRLWKAGKLLATSNLEPLIFFLFWMSSMVVVMIWGRLSGFSIQQISSYAIERLFHAISKRFR